MGNPVMAPTRALAKEVIARIIVSEFFGVANARRDAERAAERILLMMEETFGGEPRAASVDTLPQGQDRNGLGAEQG